MWRSAPSGFFLTGTVQFLSEDIFLYRCRQYKKTQMQLAFNSNKLIGLYQAPVLASIKSEIPKIRKKTLDSKAKGFMLFSHLIYFCKRIIEIAHQNTPSMILPQNSIMLMPLFSI